MITLGFDVGGTKVAYGTLVNGRLLDSQQVPAPPGDYEALVALIADVVSGSEIPVDVVGVGAESDALRKAPRPRPPPLPEFKGTPPAPLNVGRTPVLATDGVIDGGGGAGATAAEDGFAGCGGAAAGSSAVLCRTIWPWPTRAAAASSAGDIVGRGLSAPGWAPDAGDADRGDSDRGDSDDGDAHAGDADDGDADRGDADRGDHLGEQLADTHMGEPLALRCFWSGGGLRASWANLHALP